MPWDFEAYVTTPLPGGLYTNKAAYIYYNQSVWCIFTQIKRKRCYT